MDSQTNRFYTQTWFWLIILGLVLMGLFYIWRYGLPFDIPRVNQEQTQEERTENSVGELYIGLSVSGASQLAEAEGRDHRIIHQDGEDLPVTMDYRENRINFWVEDGIVADAKTDAEMAEN